MSKLLIRIVTFLLVSCLMADSATGVSPTNPLAPLPATEALAGPPSCSGGGGRGCRVRGEIFPCQALAPVVFRIGEHPQATIQQGKGSANLLGHDTQAADTQSAPRVDPGRPLKASQRERLAQAVSDLLQNFVGRSRDALTTPTEDIRKVLSRVLCDLTTPELAAAQTSSPIPFEQLAVDLFQSSQDSTVRFYALKTLVHAHSERTPLLVQAWIESLNHRARQEAEGMLARARRQQKITPEIARQTFRTKWGLQDAWRKVLEILILLKSPEVPEIMARDPNAFLLDDVEGIGKAVIEAGDESLLEILKAAVQSLELVTQHLDDDRMKSLEGIRRQQAILARAISELGDTPWVQTQWPGWLESLSKGMGSRMAVDTYTYRFIVAYDIAEKWIATGDADGALEAICNFLSEAARPPLLPVELGLDDLTRFQEVNAARSLAVKLWVSNPTGPDAIPLIKFLLAPPTGSFKRQLAPESSATPALDLEVSVGELLRSTLRTLLYRDREVANRQQAALDLLRMGDEGTVEFVIKELPNLTQGDLSNYGETEGSFHFLEAILDLLLSPTVNRAPADPAEPLGFGSSLYYPDYLILGAKKALASKKTEKAFELILNALAIFRDAEEDDFESILEFPDRINKYHEAIEVLERLIARSFNQVTLAPLLMLLSDPLNAADHSLLRQRLRESWPSTSSQKRWRLGETARIIFDGHPLEVVIDGVVKTRTGRSEYAVRWGNDNVAGNYTSDSLFETKDLSGPPPAAAQKVGRLLTLSSQSFAGDSTLRAHLLKQRPDLVGQPTYTTRPARRSEIYGEDYLFVTPKQFRGRVRRNQMLAPVEYVDHWYGVPKTLLAQLMKGKNVVMALEVEALSALRKAVSGIASITAILVTAPRDEREKRADSHQGNESRDQIRRRLDEGDREAMESSKFDHVIVNTDLNASKQQIINLANDVFLPAAPDRDTKNAPSANLFPEGHPWHKWTIAIETLLCAVVILAATFVAPYVLRETLDPWHQLQGHFIGFGVGYVVTTLGLPLLHMIAPSDYDVREASALIIPFAILNFMFTFTFGLICFSDVRANVSLGLFLPFVVLGSTLLSFYFHVLFDRNLKRMSHRIPIAIPKVAALVGPLAALAALFCISISYATVPTWDNTDAFVDYFVNWLFDTPKTIRNQPGYQEMEQVVRLGRNGAELIENFESRLAALDLRLAERPPYNVRTRLILNLPAIYELMIRRRQAGYAELLIALLMEEGSLALDAAGDPRFYVELGEAEAKARTASPLQEGNDDDVQLARQVAAQNVERDVASLSPALDYLERHTRPGEVAGVLNALKGSPMFRRDLSILSNTLDLVRGKQGQERKRVLKTALFEYLFVWDSEEIASLLYHLGAKAGMVEMTPGPAPDTWRFKVLKPEFYNFLFDSQYTRRKPPQVVQSPGVGLRAA